MAEVDAITLSEFFTSATICGINAALSPFISFSVQDQGKPPIEVGLAKNAKLETERTGSSHYRIGRIKVRQTILIIHGVQVADLSERSQVVHALNPPRSFFGLSQTRQKEGRNNGKNCNDDENSRVALQRL